MIELFIVFVSLIFGLLLFNIINNKKISDFEIEKLFMEVDEKFYEDAYELTKIIMIELSDFTSIKINNLKEKWRIMKKLKK